MNIQVILCILTPYFFAENDFFKPTHPTKVRKIPHFFLKPSLTDNKCAINVPNFYFHLQPSSDNSKNANCFLNWEYSIVYVSPATSFLKNIVKGYWHRSKQLIPGYYPYTCHISNKKWPLNEEYVKHLLYFQQV